MLQIETLTFGAFSLIPAFFLLNITQLDFIFMVYQFIRYTINAIQ